MDRLPPRSPRPWWQWPIAILALVPPTFWFVLSETLLERSAWYIVPLVIYVAGLFFAIRRWFPDSRQGDRA